MDAYDRQLDVIARSILANRRLRGTSVVDDASAMRFAELMRRHRRGDASVRPEIARLMDKLRDRGFKLITEPGGHERMAVKLGFVGLDSESAVGLNIQIFELNDVEVSGAAQWWKAFYESVIGSRKLYGQRFVSDADNKEFNALVDRWNAFMADTINVNAASKTINLMKPATKQAFADIMRAAQELSDRFVSKGMAQIQIPYMADMVIALRSLPKTPTAKTLAQFLRTVAAQGRRMLDENTVWWAFWRRRDAAGLRRAVDAAAALANKIDKEIHPDQVLHQSEAIYKKAIRTATLVWNEGSALYGVTSTKEAALAELPGYIQQNVNQAAKIGFGLFEVAAIVGIGYFSLGIINTARQLARSDR